MHTEGLAGNSQRAQPTSRCFLKNTDIISLRAGLAGRPAMLQPRGTAPAAAVLPLPPPPARRPPSIKVSSSTTLHSTAIILANSQALPTAAAAAAYFAYAVLSSLVALARNT